jgi:DNA-directed RNA polymerase subunit RPC12/RpoP
MAEKPKTAIEKIAYLSGLAEGQGLTDETKEGRLSLAIIDALEALAQELAAVREATSELDEELEAISESFGEMSYLLEELADDDDDDDDCDDEDCDCCDGCDDDELSYSTGCPKCGEDIEIDEDDLTVGFVVCPKCGEKLEFEFVDDEDDEGDDADGI